MKFFPPSILYMMLYAASCTTTSLTSTLKTHFLAQAFSIGNGNVMRTSHSRRSKAVFGVPRMLNQQHLQLQLLHRHENHRLMAIIYAPDDNTGSSLTDTDMMHDMDFSSNFWTNPFPEDGPQQHLIQELNNANHVSALARLASAFAPPGHELHLPNIQSVSIVGIDETHIDIQTVICDSMGCVTIKVPVLFPQACSDIHDEECILHQFEELDHHAEQLLQLQERQLHEQHHMSEERQQLLRELNDYSSGLDLPSWWVPSGVALAQECQNIRTLLNGNDFQAEVRSLASSGLVVTPDSVHCMVEKAVVSQVGPAGLYLRALVTDIYRGHPGGENTASTRLMDIPLAFGMIAETVEDLRAVVLGAVASIADEEHQVQPVVNAPTHLMRESGSDMELGSEDNDLGDYEMATIPTIETEAEYKEHEVLEEPHSRDKKSDDHVEEYWIDNFGRLTRIFGMTPFL